MGGGNGVEGGKPNTAQEQRVRPPRAMAEQLAPCLRHRVRFRVAGIIGQMPLASLQLRCAHSKISGAYSGKSVKEGMVECFVQRACAETAAGPLM